MNEKQPETLTNTPFEKDDFQSRIPFGLNCDDETLKQCWNMIEPEIEHSLNGYIAEILNSNLNSYFKLLDVNSLKAQVIAHCRWLFIFQMDEEQLKKNHYRSFNSYLLRQSKAYFISSYMCLLRIFHQIILENADNQSQADELINTVNMIVAVDIERQLMDREDFILIE